MKTVYYAHCISIFDTEQERRDVGTLEALGLRVFNPNCTACTEGYKKNGMDHFFPLVDACEVFAFRSLASGEVPSGIYQEFLWAVQQKKAIIELPTAVQRRALSVDQTREYLKECGKR